MADANIDVLAKWILLAVCRLQPNANAVLIREEIKKRTGRTPGNVYVPLFSLRKKGFVKNSPSRERTTSGRVRKQPIVVHLTEQGERILKEWLRAIDSLRRNVEKK